MAGKASSPDADLGFVGQRGEHRPAGARAAVGLRARWSRRWASTRRPELQHQRRHGRRAPGRGARRAQGDLPDRRRGHLPRRRRPRQPHQRVPAARTCASSWPPAPSASGMIPKLGAIADALESGVGAAHIVDGRVPALGADRDLHRDRHRDEGDGVIDEMLVAARGGRADADLPAPAGGVRARRGRVAVRRRRPPLRRLHGRHLDEQRRPLPPGGGRGDRRPGGAA